MLSGSRSWIPDGILLSEASSNLVFALCPGFCETLPELTIWRRIYSKDPSSCHFLRFFKYLEVGEHAIFFEFGSRIRKGLGYFAQQVQGCSRGLTWDWHARFRTEMSLRPMLTCLPAMSNQTLHLIHLSHLVRTHVRSISVYSSIRSTAPCKYIL